MSDFLKVGNVLVIQKELGESALKKLQNVIFSEKGRIIVENSTKNNMTLFDMFGEKLWYSGKIYVSYDFPLSYIKRECQGSPWGICIYDHEKDSMHDHCLICGEPEERK